MTTEAGRSLVEIIECPEIERPAVLRSIWAETGDCFRDPAMKGAWVVFDYRTVRDLLPAPELSSAVLHPERVTRSEDRRQVWQIASRMMIAQDGHAHTGMRRPVTSPFTAHQVGAVADAIRETAAGLLDGLRPAGAIDIVSDFAGVYPVLVIMGMLGIPPEHLATLKALSDQITPAVTTIFLTDEVAARGADGLRALRRWWDAYVAGRCDGSPVMNGLLGAGLGPEEEFANFVLLLVAGHETTTRLIGGMATVLLQEPGGLARIGEEPDLRANAVTEGFRWVTPFQMVARETVAPIELSPGHRAEPGDRVLLMLCTANRDPRVYVSPDEYRRGRVFAGDERPLTFGAGSHRCLGAELARLEADAAWEVLATFPGLRLAVAADSLDWGGSTMLFRGPTRVPALFTPHHAVRHRGAASRGWESGWVPRVGTARTVAAEAAPGAGLS